MTDNSKRVFGFLKEHYGEDLTANNIADALDVSVAIVTGSVNGLVKKGYAVRNKVEGEKDGKKATIKYITLTEEGYNFDPEAAE